MIAEKALSFLPSDPGAEPALDFVPRLHSAPGGPRPQPDADQQEEALCARLQGISQKQQDALSAFYDATVSRVFGLALRITGRPDAAEEVVSDVYMQVWRDAARYDPGRGRVLGWVLTICRSRAIDSLRRRDELEPLPAYEELRAADGGPATDPQELLAAVQDHSALHRALQALTPLQRQLLALAFFRGLTHEEIAQHNRLPLGSVKTHIRKALSVLRSQLTDGTLENKT